MARRVLACLFAGAVASVVAVEESEKDLDLVLYGATGCLGGIAAKWFAQQKGLRWAVAGRNALEIQAVATKLCGSNETLACPQQIVAPLDAKHDAKTWVQRTRAVMSTAGPYSLHGGEFLIEACAQLGVHYVDSSDEFYWQRRMADGYDAVARASGAHVVLAGGFCALVGDLGAQLALAEAGAKAGSTAHVDAWLETYNGGLSAGVLNTFKALSNASYPKEWETDPYVLAPNASASLKVDTSVTGVGKVGWDSLEGVITENVFGPYDARLLRRSFTELGQAVHFRAGARPGVYTKWAGFLALHPGSWTSLTKCPTQAVQEQGSWQMRVRASADGGSSASAATVVLSGAGDPGYRFTALSIAEVGLCLAGYTKNCLRSSAVGGVAPPMVALDPAGIRARLASVGLLKMATVESDAIEEAPAEAITV